MILLALSLLARPSAARRPPTRQRASGPSQRTPSMPLRLVVSEGKRRVANCVFATVELPENAPAGSPLRMRFAKGDPIWGRCFLPERAGRSGSRDLVDYVTIDGHAAWEQAYDRPLGEGTFSHLVPYADVLRTALAQVSPGAHRVHVVGKLRRAGQSVTLYRGDFYYLR